jgi:hypothetical protein
MGLLLALAACNEGSIFPDVPDAGPGDEGNLSTPTKTDRIVQVTKPEVDILWVVDNSCSMIEEQTALGKNFPEFIQYFLDSNLDWHIGLVSTDTENPDENGKLIGAGGYKYLDNATPRPEDVFQQMSALGINGSATERGLLAAYRALTQPTDKIKQHNAGFYRDDAALHVIVISDEEDQSAPEVRRNEFVTFLQGLKADEDVPVSLSAIVGPLPGGCHGAGGDAVPGSIYIGVARATGGLTESICDDDWVPLLRDLGLHAAGLRREYFLTEVPVPQTIEVWVEDGDTQYHGVDEAKITPTHTLIEECEAEGYYGGSCFTFAYDVTRNSITIDQAHVPTELAEVFIHYELLSGLQPERDDVLGGDTDGGATD